MNHYQYQGDKLLCEDLEIESITNEIETPFYCYSLRSLKDNINKYKEDVPILESAPNVRGDFNKESRLYSALTKVNNGMIEANELMKKNFNDWNSSILSGGIYLKSDEIEKELQQLSDNINEIYEKAFGLDKKYFTLNHFLN